MKKLTKRLIYERHTAILNKRIDNLLEQLRKVVDEGFAAAQQHYKDELAKWSKQDLAFLIAASLT
jgi:hypothetical protein